MSPRVATVLLALSFVLVATAALAEPPAGPQTVTYPIRGQNHRFAIPPGFVTYPGADGVAFAAPPAKLKGTFNCVIMGAAMPSGVDSTAALVKMLAENEIKDRKPWAKIVEQKKATFVGVEGDLTFLRGTDPEKKADVIQAYVAARVGQDVYVFAAEGLLEDFNTLAGDLDTILNGVTPLGTTAPAAPADAKPGTPAGSFGDEGAAPPPNQAGPPTGGAPEVSDPLWGLEIGGLDPSWRLKLEGNAYVLMHGDPPATVVVQRIAMESPAKLAKAKELAKAAKGRFGGKEAFVVDGKRDGAPERAFYVPAGDHAIVVRFGSPTFDSAIRRHLPDIERAIRVTSSTVQVGRKGGVSLTMPFGVELSPLPPPWRLDFARGGAGSVVLVDPDAGVRTELRVRLPELASENPFFGEEQTFATTCSTRKGTYDELAVAMVGARSARRFRCRNAHYPNGDPMAALMYHAVGDRSGRSVHILTLSFFETATGETPDRAVADFMQYVRVVKP